MRREAWEAHFVFYFFGFSQKMKKCEVGGFSGDFIKLIGDFIELIGDFIELSVFLLFNGFWAF